MLIEVPDVLDAGEVALMRASLDAAEWVDGRETAGHLSAQVKRNRQLPERSPVGMRLAEAIIARLEKNALFITAALPQRILPPLFNRYEGGMDFGFHVDNAIRPSASLASPLRSDLSATLFLSDPDSYDGGELVVEDMFGSHTVKLEAGSMVLYPASSLHKVTPVTRGARISAFFWVQSMVRDDGERRLLLELDLAIGRIRGETPDHPSVLSLTNVYHNLLRRWATP